MSMKDPGDSSLEKKLSNFKPQAEKMPGVVVIHQLNPFGPIYMTSNGLALLGIELAELTSMGPDYHQKFFNNEDMTDFVYKMDKLLRERDPNETFTFFQQVKFKNSPTWTWHISSARIFHQANDGTPTHTITISIPINELKHIPNKAERLLDESIFFKQNLNKYLSLGKREIEILKLVAMGYSSPEIAVKLFISIDTVNTHRKNVKQKLGIQTNFEFTEYAQAFDLI